MAQNSRVPCARCGRLRPPTKGRTVLVCHECRRQRPEPSGRRSTNDLPAYRRCGWCADRFAPRTRTNRFCSLSCYARCDGDRRRIRAIGDPHSNRQMREMSAPGMGGKARSRLLAQWVRQGRRCAYCEAPATTVDHVVPLIRGGTNYEGNLAPCCKRCNSSKAGWLLVEWRTGRRLAAMRYTLTKPIAPPRRCTKPAEQIVLRLCSTCTALFAANTANQKRCSPACRQAKPHTRAA